MRSDAYEGLIDALRKQNRELQAKLNAAYDDCIDAVNKIKDDPITEMGSHHRLEGSFQTAKTWMVAIAEDIEREIIARKEKSNGTR